MKKLLGLLGTIMITGNAIPSVIAAAPNRKHNIKKRQNNENISTTSKTQDEQQSQFSAISDSEVDIIEKEITLDENYSENIQKILQELIDKNYIDPLRTLNMGGLLSSELDNKTIISKLEELEPKMVDWIKKKQNNKNKILILILKNSNKKRIKLVIRLENFYVLGFINNQNQYFNFKDEKIKQINDLENEITKLGEKTKQNATKYDKLQKDLAKAQIIQNINKTIIKKYDYQNINLNYTGDYNEEGLDVIIREEKIDKGKSILISKKTLNDAINQLSILEDENKQNQEIKDDLVRLIFATSEAMRFQCDEKSLEIYAEFKNDKELTNEEIDSLKKEIDKKQKEKNQLKKEIKNIIEKNLGKKSNIIQLIKIDNWDQIINEIDSNIENTDELIEIKKQIEKIKENEEKINEIKRNLEITELNKIIKGSKNILVDIKEKIFNKTQTITWSEYTTQLRGNKKEFGGWKDYSEMLNKFRIEIWEQLIKIKKMYDFIYNNQDIINEIFKKENENYNIIKAVENLFDNPQNKEFSDKKNKVEILNYIQKQIEIRKFFGKLYNMINIKQININENQLIYNIGINKNQENFLLVISVYQKNLDIIKLLINLFPKSEIINGNSNDFFSPLNIALSLRYTEIVKELLKHKNINLNKTEPLCNTSPLHTAVRLGKTEIVKELLKNPKIDVNLKAINDITPLHLAVIIGNNEIVWELLKHPKINVNVIAKKDNLTNPFSVEIFDKLKHYDTNINLEEKIKLTPLFFAEIFGKTQIAEELLKHPKINTESSLKKIIPNLFEEEMEKHFNSKEFEQEFEQEFETQIDKILKNKIKLFNELLEKPIDEKQKNKIIKSLEETKKALEDLKKPKRNEKLYKEKQETEENKKISEEIIKKIEEDINSKEFQEQFKNNFINELNKYFKQNKELKEFSKIIQNYDNLVKEKQNELVKEALKIKLWDFIITNRNLGEIADNSEQTILKNVRELNPKLDFLKKIKVTNINITTALITSNDKNCSGGVIVTFTVDQKSNETIRVKNKKNELGFGGFKSGFLNQPPKSGNNSNSNISVSDHPRTSETQGRDSNKKQENTMYNVPSDNSCLFWSVATAYLLPVRNNNEEFKNRFIQLFGEENLKYLQLIQKLLKQYDLENNRNLNQLWYQNQIANNLVTNVFRNNVVDYIKLYLDTIATRNGELTFSDLIQNNNEIPDNYLERMRNINSWGGEIEIIAMSNRLNANISVNNDAPYQPINQNSTNTNSTNTINIFHVNNGTHYNFALLENVEVNNTNSQETTTTVKNQQKLTETEQPKTNITISNKSTGSNNNNVPVPSVNKPININISNSQETTTKKAINKYNALSKEEKQQKLNEINQHYQNLSENDKKVFKDKLRNVGLGLTSTGISGTGILGISKMTGISPIKGLSTTANYIKNSLSTTRTFVSTGTGEAVEMTPLLSESTVAESLTAAETLSVTEGSAVVATEGAVIGTEAGTAAALAPETLGLSLLIGGLVIAGTAIFWWINYDHKIVKHESHNQYNEIEKYYKFLSRDQIKLDININEWNKIKKIYQENSNNYKEFKNQIKSEITNFHKEDHSGWGGSINDEDINTLINIIYNHFQEINNHFLSNPNHGWKIITNTVGSYFIIEEE